ncbi:MAG: ribonuclease HII [Candidatus Hydrothermarchaeales archaeon]
MLCGVDEAGRGPVIGPLVIAGVLASEDEIVDLIALGVKDSKKLSKERRSRLYRSIANEYQCYSIQVGPLELDELRRRGTSLNEIEAQKFAEVIDILKPRVAFIDAADVLPSNFQKAVQGKLRINTALVVEHKADERYPIVSAASIIAKVERDNAIEGLCGEYGDIGSGYPSDPITQKFLEEWFHRHHEFPDFVRKSWKTLNVIRNSKISDFLE